MNKGMNKEETLNERLNEQIEARVISDYTKGLTYREISKRNKVSLGKILSIIKEAKQGYPDLEQLREIRSKLPKELSMEEINDLMNTILEINGRYKIKFKEMLSFIERKEEEFIEFNELTAKKESLIKEINDLESKLNNMKDEINNYIIAKNKLEGYGISFGDIKRLKKLLDSLLLYGLDADKCVKTVEEYDFTIKQISRIKSKLDELTMWKSALSYSLMLLEEQHSEKSFKLRMKLNAIERKEDKINKLNASIAMLKDELSKLENDKNNKIAIINDLSKEKERLQKIIDDYKKREEELKKEIDEKKEQIESLDMQIKHLKHNIEYYEKSSTIREIETKLKIAELKFYSLLSKAIERDDYNLMKYVVEEVNEDIKKIKKRIGLEDKSNIITIER
jgi:structural maintenance of chromosome 3 (chondroitin sulfate proteoglycan 6)